MSAITPETNVKLLSLDLELDNKNQLSFSSKEEQTNYFLNKSGITLNNFTYQRKDGIIRYPAHIDTLLSYNYAMYQNENYSNKYFYAFIEEMNYINDSMTEIKIKTDVFQTWQFDFEFKKSFVEREIVSDDTIGKNTIPENLEYGEYVQVASNQFSNGDYMFLIEVGEFYHNRLKRIATNVGGIPMPRWVLFM